MSDWRIVITPDFKADLRGIHNYIAGVLSAPEAARGQVHRIMATAKSLKTMPLKFTLYDKEPWRSRGLRKAITDNFVIFYLPNENTKEVAVFRVFYGGQDIDGILKNELQK